MPAYIKLPGITGECNEQSHQGWIEVESVSLPIYRSIQAGAVGVQRSCGETSLGDISVVKSWDSSTPDLASACSNGKFLNEVTIHLCSTINDKNVTNLEVKLQNAIISNYSFSAVGNLDPVPTEQISLNYTSIEWNYMKYKQDGKPDKPTRAKYDTEAAKT